jgi:hypothetical protein
MSRFAPSFPPQRTSDFDAVRGADLFPNLCATKDKRSPRQPYSILLRACDSRWDLRSPDIEIATTRPAEILVISNCTGRYACQAALLNGDLFSLRNIVCPLRLFETPVNSPIFCSVGVVGLNDANCQIRGDGLSSPPSSLKKDATWTRKKMRVLLRR